MRYAIRHELRQVYPAPVWEQHIELRLTPQHNAHQRVRALDVTVEPACATREYVDCFGNRVHYCSLTAPHEVVAARVRAEIETALENPFDYPIVAAADERSWLDDRLRREPRLWDYVLHRSAATPDAATLASIAFEIPPRDPSRPLLDSVMAALAWIAESIACEPGFARAATPLADVLTRRTGTCQDLAHLLISTVRAWGFPARYVMGYQDPSYAEEDGEVERLHGWAEVLVPGAGWRGIDPTTRLVANHTYIAAAVGRDAADAAPIKDVFKGGEHAEPAETEIVLEVRGNQ